MSEKENNDAPSSSGGQGKPKRFEILKMRGVAVWAWDMLTEHCAICRNLNSELCIECEAEKKPNEEDCVAVWGMCNHVFHDHCLSRWLQTRPVCPLDNTEWQCKKFGLR